MPRSVFSFPSSSQMKWTDEYTALSATDRTDASNYNKLLFNNGGSLEWISHNGVEQPVFTDGSGKIDQSLLPSYVDDFVEYADFASFPPTGETGKIYLDIALNKTYRWSGSQYSVITDFSNHYNKTEIDTNFYTKTTSDGKYVQIGDAITTTGTNGINLSSDIVKNNFAGLINYEIDGSGRHEVVITGGSDSLGYWDWDKHFIRLCNNIDIYNTLKIGTRYASNRHNDAGRLTYDESGNHTMNIRGGGSTDGDLNLTLRDNVVVTKNLKMDNVIECKNDAVLIHQNIYTHGANKGLNLGADLAKFFAAGLIQYEINNGHHEVVITGGSDDVNNWNWDKHFIRLCNNVEIYNSIKIATRYQSNRHNDAGRLTYDESGNHTMNIRGGGSTDGDLNLTLRDNVVINKSLKTNGSKSYTYADSQTWTSDGTATTYTYNVPANTNIASINWSVNNQLQTSSVTITNTSTSLDGTFTNGHEVKVRVTLSHV